MLWNTFEEDKKILQAQYTPQKLDRTSGQSHEQVLAACREIEAKDMPLCLKNAEEISYILKNAYVGIDECDWYADHIDFAPQIIGGILRPARMQETEKSYASLLSSTANAVKNHCYGGGSDFSHTAPDFFRLLALGLPGLKQEAASKLAGADAQAAPFYQSVCTVYEAFTFYLRRLASLCRNAEHERARFVGQALENLCVRAPETVQEALQLIYLFYNVQSNVECTYFRSFGCLDQLLEPFWEKDRQRGMTEEQLRELIRYFIIKLDALHVDANQPFALGVVEKDGSVRVNRLSYIIAEEFIALAPVYTKIHIRYGKELPRDFMHPILQSIIRGANSFVFINNRIAAKALQRLGEDPADCTDYGIVGCYEIYAPGKELPCTCNGSISLPKAVEAALFGGKDLMTAEQNVPSTGEAYPTFEALWQSVKDQLDYFIDQTFALIDNSEGAYPQVHTSPLLSSTYASCMEKGRDIYAGGAVYNSSSINVFGLATAADALIAIKKLVFEEKKLPLEELKAILQSNWQDRELLRLQVLHKYPKYGTDDQEADALAVALMEHCAKRINGRPNGRGGTYRMGSFSIDWRIAFGQTTGASADGRKAGEPLSKNTCAYTARDTRGITAHVLSATKPDYTLHPNGTVLDLVFHASAVQGREGETALLATLDSFIERGGFALQCNVLSPAVLRDAQAHPEKYETLQVRLCGWNVRFIDLSKQEQDDFIRQTEVSAS